MTRIRSLLFLIVMAAIFSLLYHMARKDNVSLQKQIAFKNDVIASLKKEIAYLSCSTGSGPAALGELRACKVGDVPGVESCIYTQHGNEWSVCVTDFDFDTCEQCFDKFVPRIDLLSSGSIPTGR